MIVPNVERGAHLIGRFLDRTVAELGITQGEAHVLAALERDGPMPIGMLHREFGHKRSTLTNIVDRLERRELIRRAANPHDRRSVLIGLTTPGRDAAARVATVLNGLEQQVRERVGDRDIRGFEALIEALESVVRRHERADG